MKIPKYKNNQDVYVICDGIPIKKIISNASNPGGSIWYRMWDSSAYCEEELYETYEKALNRGR